MTRCTPGGVAFAKEVHAGGLERPADILLLGWDKGRDVCVDLTVRSPTTLDAFPLSVERTKRLLREAEKDKLAAAQAACAVMGWGCHPVAYSTWGGAGPECGVPTI